MRNSPPPPFSPPSLSFSHLSLPIPLFFRRTTTAGDRHNSGDPPATSRTTRNGGKRGKRERKRAHSGQRLSDAISASSDVRSRRFRWRWKACSESFLLIPILKQMEVG
ncbi:hypothetical protein P3X46_028172 [Hevea brasiliensis]|uniref:Uncharacterized protein n=1 Tax=Hevea brasiliensis TaxID=3981 RepID=A0ABQ9KP13_HEVBR|nr:hypothetical protein P3X46_028172 [Hevea brasiliensis]